MMMLHRRNLWGLRPAAFAVLMAGAVFFLVSSPAPVKACWNIVEYQCFDVLEQDMPWPWTHPTGTNRQWRRFPAVPPPAPGVTWGFEDRVYDTHNCPSDAIALWCVGYPPSNDPDFDTYARGMDDYITYGPVNLANATAARASFWLYNRSEAAHDSIFWGCATTSNLNSAATMNVSGKHSGLMTSSFEQRTIDFSHVVNLASGDTLSMLGQSAVYVFWRFRSDVNMTVDKGAFIDNVTISVDDGGVDLVSNSVSTLAPDSSYISHPQPTDTMFARYSWRSCSGGSGVYPDFHVIGKVYSRFDTLTILDTLITDVTAGETVMLYSRQWQNAHPDSHWVRFTVDALNQVVETDETNNMDEDAFFIPLPIPFTDFHWITPATEQEVANQTAILRWEAHDDLEATLTFSIGSDSGNCAGTVLPGGNRPVRGLDSLIWNVNVLPTGRILWPFVRVINPGWDSCICAPYSILVNHSAVGERPDGGIPTEYFLAQNFPNPFNPTTEFRYGIAVGGHVSLKVYDVLGRQVTELVNGNRAPGSYVVSFDGTNLTTGSYIYTLTTPEGTQSRKMMLMK